MVDDGSTDGTAAEVERWVMQLGTDAVRLLTLDHNQGKGAAVGKVGGCRHGFRSEAFRETSSLLFSCLSVCSMRRAGRTNVLFLFCAVG